MKRLSIIVPMYNVEPYVERCIRSLEDQDIPWDDYEIICINDGSPDGCLRVVMQLQDEYDNIILIDQDNQGVSIARNNGINRAEGKFILMIDPDDYVIPGIFSRIINYAEKNNAEVTFLGFRFLLENGEIRKEIQNKEEIDKLYTGIIASEISRGDGSIDPDRTWALLFNRDFINKNDFRYLPHVPYLEDGELIARILCLAKRCVFFGETFYIRTTRPNSATRSNLFYSKEAMHGFIKSARNLREFKESQSLNDEQIGYLNKKIIKFIVLSVTSTLKLNNLNRIFYLKRYFRANNLQKLNLNGVSESYIKYGEKANKSLETLFVYLIYEKFKNKIMRLLNL